VAPQAPIIVNIKEITGNANTPIVIVQEPENSTVTDNGDGTLTIVFDKVEEDKFFAPALVFVYKDAKGVIQEAKKEFVVTQEGDVPSLIQTGYVSDNNGGFAQWLFIYALICLTYFTVSKRRRKELQK
jgi:hypothetical protein